MNEVPGDRTGALKADPSNARRRHRLSRTPPHRGERPTVAGSLLYPDPPARMETTSQEAFRRRPGPRPERGSRPRWRPRPNGGRGFPPTPRQESAPRGPAAPGSALPTGDSGMRNPTPSGERGGESSQHPAGEQGREEMTSMYQRDFPTPLGQTRRRTPALPQPDNIAVNPALRIDFSTIQRETYPGWPVVKRGVPGRKRTARGGRTDPPAKL